MQEKIKVKISINANLCISCGVCTAIHNKAFKYSEKTGKYIVTEEYKEITVTKKELDLLKQTAESCPVLAIKIEQVK